MEWCTDCGIGFGEQRAIQAEVVVGRITEEGLTIQKSAEDEAKDKRLEILLYATCH